MNDLLLHSKTRQALQQVAAGGAHAILLKGELGAGKHAIATALATELLGTKPQNASYFLNITADGKSIGIEQIRELQKFLQLKTTGNGKTRRVVVIDDADTMTVEAQNALLKLLEESPADTALILTAHKPHQLRPTIHSRVQTINVLPPLKDDVLGYFLGKGFSGTDIERALQVSNGQVGLMTALLDNSTDHALAAHIVTAKELYGMSAFERLTKVDEIAKEKDSLPDLLFACKRICTSALEQAAMKQQDSAVKTWHKQLKLIVSAESSLKHNPNPKLLLTNLFISM